MPIIYPNYMKPEEYFKNIPDIGKKYEAMKSFFIEKKTAEEVASMYGYTVHTVYSFTKKFRRDLKSSTHFFYSLKKDAPSMRIGTKSLILLYH